MCLWSENKIVMYDLSITPLRTIPIILHTFAVLYRTRSVTSNTLSWTKASAWQTMIPWHLLLCLFYMRIFVSNVTLSVPCYRMRAHVITFLPVFLWRVTYGDWKLFVSVVNACLKRLFQTLSTPLPVLLEISPPPPLPPKNHLFVRWEKSLVFFFFSV